MENQIVALEITVIGLGLIQLGIIVSLVLILLDVQRVKKQIERGKEEMPSPRDT